MRPTSPNHVLIQPVKFGEPLKWYEQPQRAKEVTAQFPDFTFSHLEWQSYAWPGGYEIHYITKDGGVLCHQCANKELERTIDPDDDQFYIVENDINWEWEESCDHCGRIIKAEYGDDDENPIE